MTLGEKIKTRRTSLGMTQAQLARDKITRNMICLLEHDQVSPSLETLKYLSRELSIDPSYFFSENTDTFRFDRMASIDAIRDAYFSKQYADCLKSIDNLGQLDDELAFLGANAAAAIGYERLRLGSLVSAKRHFLRSKEFMAQTRYDLSLLRAKLALWESMADNIQSPRLHFPQADYEAIVRTGVDEEFYRYFLGDSDYPYTDDVLSRHMAAKAQIRVRTYQGAIRLLLEAEELGKKTEQYHAFVMLGIYTDLELCYRECGNFEQAYRYSSRRLAMAEWFKT